MPRVANNAVDYANPRVGIFFPAHNQTPADGNLTGQCVTLNKWFLAEMTDVPSPFAARGDARYVGQTLVNQGHAVKVAYSDRRRGDFAVFEYGQYGHIGVLLDADRIFEQNVNVAGVARRLVDGAYVYSARIGRLSESWRPVQATIYRIKSYNEKGDDDMPIPNTDAYYNRYRKAMRYIRGRDMPREEFNKWFVGNTDLKMLEMMLDSSEADAWNDAGKYGAHALKDDWKGQIYALQDQVKSKQGEIDSLKKQLEANGDNTALKMIIEEKQRQLDEVTANLTKAFQENDKLKADLANASGDTELLNGFGKLLNAMIVRLGLKK